jgi:hypothetical protein
VNAACGSARKRICSLDLRQYAHSLHEGRGVRSTPLMLSPSSDACQAFITKGSFTLFYELSLYSYALDIRGLDVPDDKDQAGVLEFGGLDIARNMCR